MDDFKEKVAESVALASKIGAKPGILLFQSLFGRWTWVASPEAKAFLTPETIGALTATLDILNSNRPSA